jgi:hypothetical protein
MSVMVHTYNLCIVCFLDSDLVWETDGQKLRELRSRKVCVRVEVYIAHIILGHQVRDCLCRSNSTQGLLTRVIFFKKNAVLRSVSSH